MRHSVLCFLCLLCLFCFPVRAQNRPLKTPDAEIVSPGTTRLQVGFDFLQDISFPLAGLRGDLTSVGAFSLRTGLGRIVEIQLEGVVQHFLSVTQQTRGVVTPVFTDVNTTHDFGDLSAFTKVRLLGEGTRRPAVAFRFGLQMPTSDQRRGIGSNTTNIFSELILQKHIGRVNLFGSVGLGILQSPAAQFSQNDVLLYGAAFTVRVHERVHLIGEVAGRYSSRDTTGELVGTESRAQGRLGVWVEAGGFFWDFAGIAGLHRHDPQTGFTFGLRRDIRLFGNAPKE